MARLRITNGQLSGKTIEVEDEIVIGREDTDLAIEDLEMSRRHAVVRRHANRLQVEDLGSRNGTFVDGVKIEEPTLCGGGAEIRLGTTVLVVEGVLPVASAEAEPEAVDSKATRITQVPEEAAAPAAAAPAAAVETAPAAQAAPPPAPPAPPPQPMPQAPAPASLTPFHPPERRSERGLASRSWIPVALSFGTVIVTAIALVIYFAAR